MRCIFIQSSQNHLISNLCVCTSHHLLMPLTYCSMRVNVNEKYIIHIPTKLSKSVLCRDVSPMHREAKKDKARLHNLLSGLLIFLLFFGWGWGWGGVVEMSANYIVPSIYFFYASKISYV